MQATRTLHALTMLLTLNTFRHARLVKSLVVAAFFLTSFQISYLSRSTCSLIHPIKILLASTVAHVILQPNFFSSIAGQSSLLFTFLIIHSLHFTHSTPPALLTMPKVASKRKQSAQGTAGQSPSTASNSDAAPPFWNDRTDDMLIASRKTGLPWDDIAKAHFNPKSGNACRKRYERLLARKKAAEWDGARWDAVAAGYAAARKAMWTPLAGQLGERWQDVEAKASQPTLLLRKLD